MCSKRYEIYERPQDRLKQSIIPRLRSLLPASLRSSSPYYKEFWALRDVSFQLARGEALGILGRNGAGKSTLLQVIAGTLAPTSGTVQVRGKVAALLELGSGFSPDFTGEENVRLNAALLGLDENAINQKFDAIVAFADIGDFIDQPVKTYSSGMMLRLAFAVQTAVEPDLLIVDEALSVGDARFQKKCFTRLEQLRQRGTTILFVTHDTGTIVQFCSSAIILDGGAVYAKGSPQVMARQYHRLLFDGEPASCSRNPGDCSQRRCFQGALDTSAPNAVDQSVKQAKADGGHLQSASLREVRYGSRDAEIFEIGIRDETGCETRVIDLHHVCEFYFKVRFHRTIENPVAYGFMISNTRGVEIFATKAAMHGKAISPSPAGSVYICRLRAVMPIVPGTYLLSVSIAHDDQRSSSDFLDCRFDALQFQMIGMSRSFSTSVVEVGGMLSHESQSDPVSNLHGDPSWVSR